VPNLKVSIVSSQVTVPTARDEFPARSDYTVHAAVTQGKPTGHNADDPIWVWKRGPGEGLATLMLAKQKLSS